MLLVHAFPANWMLFLGVLCIVSILFSSIGLVLGLMAEKFDHLAVITTFVITPLTFVGGVFTTWSMLPAVLRPLEYFNPIFYTIEAFRYSYNTQSSTPSLAVSLCVISAMAAVAFGIALRLVSIGYKLRT
jgi:ABC-2 type transport system permease protein